MAVFGGAAAIAAVYCGSVAAQSVYVGTVQVWSAFTPMGVRRSTEVSRDRGDQPYRLITFDEVLAEYPGTDLASGGAVAGSNGDLRVTLVCTTDASSSVYSQTFRPYVNGVGVGGPVTVYRGEQNLSWDIAVSSGDLVQMWWSQDGTSDISSGATMTLTAIPE